MYKKKIAGAPHYRCMTGALLSLGLVVTLFMAGGCASPVRKQARRPFTVVVLPDTQCYADVREKWTQKHFKIPDQSFCFYEQTKWIKDNRRDHNIVMVAHVGDIVQYDHPAEWEIADKAFRTIDGSVPYILSSGNHDMGCEKKKGTAHSRDSKMDDYFPPSRFKENSLYSYGGNLDDSSHNYYITFKGGDMDFLILSLEFKPQDKALAWANNVIAAHPKHRCIIVTHAYLMKNGARYKKIGYAVDGNAGEAIWQKLISQHQSIFMVLCGHTEPNARLTSKGIGGNEVHQLLSDFQFDKGGQGYLRIMTFTPEENRIDVSTYSPVLKHHRSGPRNQFSLEYDMSVTGTERLQNKKLKATDESAP